MNRHERRRDIVLPKSADVARRIYRNAHETRLLRSLHRLLVQLEKSHDVDEPTESSLEKSGGAR
jgi:hypothetical protein